MSGANEFPVFGAQAGKEVLARTKTVSVRPGMRGEPSSPEESFPSTAEASTTDPFPVVGDVLAECRLLAELGRGVRGRVFLASQAQLGDRLVVLKASSRDSGEHLSLARLLHTHIVPIFFAQVDRDRGLHVFAMPYLGGASLSSLLLRLRDNTSGPRSGRRLMEALDAEQASLPIQPLLPAAAPIRARLKQLSYSSAVCWLGACLADALQYAHERGLVHLDVKPGNVLLAADAQPLLLDFHLARPPLTAGSSPPTWFGGTPEYMSPEQHQVMRATLAGLPVPVPVDGRADVYSLGVVLYELLTGVLPHPEGPCDPASELRRRNPEVSPGLADVVARCLARAPEQRYASAGDLANDLRRHLANLPLLGVKNRNLRERWRKWRQRRPQGLRRIGLVLLALTALAGSLLLWETRLREQRRLVEQALVEGKDLLNRGDAADAIRAFHRGQTAGWFPGDAPFRQRLAEQAHKADQLVREQHQFQHRQLLTAELDRLTNELRFFWDLDTLAIEEARKLGSRCAQVWEQRSLLRAPPPDERERNNFIELTGLWARLETRLARPDQQEETRARALQRLDETEDVLGPSYALDLERQRLIPDRKGPVRKEPRTAWEHYLCGRTLLQDGKLAEAAKQYSAAVARQPDAFWPNFYQGVCAHRLHQDEEAIAAFRTCIALAPRSAPCYLNRALAALALGRKAAALADLDRAVELDPALAGAFLQRGLVHAEAGRLEEAARDLNHARTLGADPVRTHFNLAQVYRARGERAQALDHARQALQYEPAHPGAQRLLEALAGESAKR